MFTELCLRSVVCLGVLVAGYGAGGGCSGGGALLCDLERGGYKSQRGCARGVCFMCRGVCFCVRYVQGDFFCVQIRGVLGSCVHAEVCVCVCVCVCVARNWTVGACR